MKKILKVIFFWLLGAGVLWAVTYTSQYPPSHTDTYVKSATRYNDNFYPYYATNPAKSLTGTATSVSWSAANNTITNQRFHIDLGSSKVITRIYYENWHTGGVWTDRGVKDFTFWGSDNATSFGNLTYSTNTGWTQLTTSNTSFLQHANADAADPHYITVTNGTAYRYYAFKFANSYYTTGDWPAMGVRRIELQTSDAATTFIPRLGMF